MVGQQLSNLSARRELLKLWRGMPEFQVVPRQTALVIHDVQGLTTDPEAGIARRMKDLGLLALRKSYLSRMREAVRRIASLQAACRDAGVQVVYTVIEARLADGRDAAWPLRFHGLVPLPGSTEGAIQPSIRPRQDEPIILRGAFSMFSQAHGEEVLRNMGIDTIVLVGGLTDITLASTARDAADRAFRTYVVEDASFSVFQSGHQEGLDSLRLWFARITTAHRMRRKLTHTGGGQ